MNLTAWAVLGLATGLGQVPAAAAAEPAPITVAGERDVYPTKSRTQTLDVVYTEAERAAISHSELVVSRDRGQTWESLDTARPDQDHLTLKATADGLYFVNIVVNFKDGRRDPLDPARVAPQYKMLIDATAPVVRVERAERDGTDVAVAWAVDEKYPDDAATQLSYKAADSQLNDWTPVPVAAVGKGTARFRPTLGGALIVRVVASDLAGNRAEGTKDVPAGVVAANYNPPGSGGGSVGLPPPRPVEPQPAAALTPTLPPRDAPPVLPSGGPTVVMPAAPIAAPPPTVMPVPTLPISTPPGQPARPTPAPAAEPAWTPPAAPPTPAYTPPPAPASPAPLPTFGGGEPYRAAATEPPPPSAAPAHFLQRPDFDLRYEVDAGPSGLSRVDLYVTRDQGRSWTKWSSHPNAERPLKVRLAAAYANGGANADGEYGLKLVPVSGVGLADDPPAAGSPPEHRIVIDSADPQVLIYPHAVAPDRANAVLLNWVARDANFGETPMTVEWGEAPTGPWHSVAPPDASNPAGPARLANTGQYVWTLPPNMPSHRVYLRLTATDRAGRTTEVVTREPITVDLVKPKARIVFPTSPRP
jgi:hypothetical protein